MTVDNRHHKEISFNLHDIYSGWEWFYMIIYWSFLLFGDTASRSTYPQWKYLPIHFAKIEHQLLYLFTCLLSAAAQCTVHTVDGVCARRRHARCSWRRITLLFIITLNNLRSNHTFPSVGSNTSDHNCSIAWGYMLVNVGYYSAIANWAVIRWHMHKLSVSSIKIIAA